MPTVEPMSRRAQARASLSSSGAGKPQLERATQALAAGREALKRPKRPGGATAGPPAGAGSATVAEPGGPAAGPSGPTTDVALGGMMPGVSVSPRMPPPTMTAPPMPGAEMRPMLPNEPAVGGAGPRAITGPGLRAPGPGGQPDIQALIQRLQALGIGPGFGSAFPGLGVGGTAQAPPPQVSGGPAAGFRPDPRFMYA